MSNSPLVFSTGNGEKPLWNYGCHSDTILEGSAISDRNSCLAKFKTDKKQKVVTLPTATSLKFLEI